MDHPLPTQEQEGHQVFEDREKVLVNNQISQEASVKRRVRRNVKATKAVGGLSYTEILNKKLQKPEVRQNLFF